MVLIRARSLGALAVALVLAVSCTPGSPPASQVRFAQEACPADLPPATDGVELTCGYLTVPEHHAESDGSTIQLFVARYKPDGPLPTDPVVVIGGRDLAVPVLYADDMSVLPTRVGREIIVLEPRGTGHARPSLACPEVDRLDLSMLGASLGEAAPRDDLTRAVQRCWTRLSGSGIDPSAYNIEESAADVADLRTALHLTSFDIGTYGYDSKIAFEVVRRFPAGVRAVYMDSPVYPDQTIFDIAVGGTRRALRTLAETCSAQPRCQTAIPDLIAAFDAVVAHAAEAPSTSPAAPPSSTTPIPAMIDGMTIARTIRDFLSFSPASVPRELAALDRGKTSSVALYLAASRPTCFGYRLFCGTEYQPAALGAVLSILCHDEAPFTSTEALASASVDVPGLADAFVDNPYLELCTSWPVDRAGGSERMPIRSDVPILMLHGELDPYSSMPGSTTLSAMTHAYAFAFPGQSTSPIAEGSTECAQSVRAAFLDDPMAEADATCISTMDPLPLAA
jgi:pimeloyl-ACP methyl ester carboxylesterase